jgi:hypothetical protein
MILAQPAVASDDQIDPCQDRSEGCALRSEDPTEWHLRMLKELAEIGMKLARAVEQQAVPEEAPEPEKAPEPDQAPEPERARAPGRIGAGDLALVFSRIARAVRQTLALHAKIYGDRRAREEGKAAEQAQRAATIQRARKERQKNKVKRIIEEAIDAEPRDPSDYENLLADLDDALEDLDADFGDRPFGENVTRICRDLGITPNWTEWAMEVWGIEVGGIEAGATEETGTKLSPFASPRPESRHRPDPEQTGWSPEPQPWPPRTAASGSDPP